METAAAQDYLIVEAAITAMVYILAWLEKMAAPIRFAFFQRRCPWCHTAIIRFLLWFWSIGCIANVVVFKRQ
jgi:hypothetical protein